MFLQAGTIRRLTQGLGFKSHPEKTEHPENRAKNMEIVPHGPSNPCIEPATFKSQVQRSTDLANVAPLRLLYL